MDYVASLREGIMDGWGGIVLALKQSHGELFKTRSSNSLISSADTLRPYIEPIFKLLSTVANDPNRTEALLRASMGVIGWVV